MILKICIAKRDFTYLAPELTLPREIKSRVRSEFTTIPSPPRLQTYADFYWSKTHTRETDTTILNYDFYLDYKPYTLTNVRLTISLTK